MNLPIDYKSAGVDLDSAAQAIQRLRRLADPARRPEIIADVGAFAGAYRLALGKLRQPVLLANTDCVGTKLKIATLTQKYDTVGEDLVNHCVNDLICSGGEPLCFLDHVAMGKLDPQILEQIVSGVLRGCQCNGLALLGGESAELPDFYREGDFNLSGTIIGIAEEDELILGKEIQAGDVIFALPANGLHTNGYSLARQVLFEQAKLQLDQYIPELGCTLSEELLRVHPSYLEAVRAIRQHVKIKGLAHVTGGGIAANLQRIMPAGLGAQIGFSSWQRPPIFDLIQKLGPVDESEMRRVFNLGVGMVGVFSTQDAIKLDHVLPTKHIISRIGSIS